MKKLLLPTLLMLAITGFDQTTNKKMNNNKADTVCEDECDRKEIVCKLTRPDMQKRKATVIASLKRNILETKELDNGFAFKFKGSDTMVDKLTSFVKTERLCCAFFDFDLSVKGDGSLAWLAIAGPKGTKNFITAELGL